MLAELDILIKRCESSRISNAIINDINIATIKYIKACSGQKPPRHLQMTQRYLKQNSILAVPFDKGTGICLMKAETYKNKLMDILQLDQFEKLSKTLKNAKDFILKEEERVTNILTEMKIQNKINDNLLDDIKPSGSQPPRLYGLSQSPQSQHPSSPSALYAWLPILEAIRENY